MGFSDAELIVVLAKPLRSSTPCLPLVVLARDFEDVPAPILPDMC
jgi:hypothetical protein